MTTLQELYEITRQLLSEETLETGLEPLLMRTAHLIGADAAAVVQHVEDDLAVCLETAPADLLTDDIEAGFSALGTALIDGGDAFTVQPVELGEWRGLLSVPIGLHDESNDEPGVLLFFSRDEFTPDMLYVAGIVANQISLFFDNLDLYQIITMMAESTGMMPDDTD